MTSCSSGSTTRVSDRKAHCDDPNRRNAGNVQLDVGWAITSYHIDVGWEPQDLASSYNCCIQTYLSHRGYSFALVWERGIQ